MTYEEMPSNASIPHNTWIIAFCPDSDSFFATNKRAFFWETEEEFNTEADAINYFEKQINYFLDVKNEIMSNIILGWKTSDKVYMENTHKWYTKI